MITTARSIKDIWTRRPPHPRWPLKSPSAGLEARAVLMPCVTIGIVIIGVGPFLCPSRRG